uniref:30S ribosomal protein S17, chloroplastic n=1 Tax=Eutreptiella gymnastica TaxID=73025 RepID=A0A7S1N9U9_9EUGL
MAQNAKHIPKLQLLKGKVATLSKTLMKGVEPFRADKEISRILPKGVSGYEKIGTIVATYGKTVTIAVTNPVYYPRYKRTFVQTSRIKAHDETECLIEGDIVHMHSIPRQAKDKAYNVDYIIKPNIEGRLRLQLGLRAVPEPLKMYPTSKSRAKPKGTTKRSRALQPIKERYMAECPFLERAGVLRRIGFNVKMMILDEDRRQSRARRKLERLALRSATIAVAKEADAAAGEKGPRRVVFTSPIQSRLG